MFKLGAHEILVGLGSNAKDALPRLREARRRLRQHSDFELLCSSAIYESDALLPPGAPPGWNIPYLNAALKLRLRHGGCSNAELLVSRLKELETRMGRAAGPRWAPRCIDLDLLDRGGEPVRAPSACVPHPGLASRPFAFLPAEDCAPCADPPEDAPSWRYGGDLPLRTRPSSHAWPELVAILNCSPDSFSGGFAEPAALLSTAREAVSEGASVLDLGAESTRPGASPVSPEEEQARLARVLPGLTEMRRELGFALSLDSRHPSTVRWALARFPLDWLNDVEGFTHPGMLALARDSRAHLVVMHSFGVPPLAERTLPISQDPVREILRWGGERLRAFQEQGVDPARVILDPGIGFGKTARQSLALVARAGELAEIPAPWLLGHSRKRFLDPDSRFPASQRDLETALLTASLACSGVDFLRVHAPAPQARALALGNRLRREARP
jgi:2-amino-4-hydroxy-6-hydroxymethyldihydropteridine diphosphokinase/dihydropteroate synthase